MPDSGVLVTKQKKVTVRGKNLKSETEYQLLHSSHSSASFLQSLILSYMCLPPFYFAAERLAVPSQRWRRGRSDAEEAVHAIFSFLRP